MVQQLHYTALHAAADQGQTAMVKFLVERGADVNLLHEVCAVFGVPILGKIHDRVLCVCCRHRGTLLCTLRLPLGMLKLWLSCLHWEWIPVATTRCLSSVLVQLRYERMHSAAIGACMCCREDSVRWMLRWS